MGTSLRFARAMVLAVGLGICAPAQVTVAAQLQLQPHAPGLFVHAAAQTTDGFLWVGTKSGLLRFDGVRLVPFRPAAGGHLLEEQRVRALLGRRDGTLWAVTSRDGLVIIEHGRVTRVADVSTGAAESAELAEDRAGALWVRTTEGAARFHQGKWRLFACGKELPSGPTRKMVIGDDGAVRIETAEAWSRFDGERFEAPTPRSSTVARGERLLAWSLPPGAPSADDARFASVRAADISTTLHDPRTGYWVATRRGLWWFPSWDEAPVLLTDRDGLLDRRVVSLMADRAGSVWAVTLGGGLMQLRRPRVFPHRTQDGLGGSSVFAVAADASGAVWVTTTEGLSRYQHGVFTNYIGPEHDEGPGLNVRVPGFPSRGLRSVLAARDGSVWVATRPAALFRFDGQRFIRVPLPPVDDRDVITAFHEDSAGDLLLATGSGQLLRRTPDGQVHVVPWNADGCAPPDGGERRCARAIDVIIPRRAGGLWLGTFGAGVWRLDGTRAVPQPWGAAQDAPRVRGLYEDERGVLWIATGRGLARAEGENVIFVGLGEGGTRRALHAIAEDPAGDLWLGAERGVVQVQRSALDAEAAGGPPATSLVYDARDGLPSDETRVLFDHPVVRARDGRLWFAMATGLAVVAPPLGEPATPPEPVVEEVVVNGAARSDVDTPAVIQPGRGDLTFRFTAPALVAPHRLTLLYQLEGFDDGWTRADLERRAQYTNVPPGRYTFKVKAILDGRTSSQQATYALRLLPAFHQTIWFRVLLASALLAAVALVFALRNRNARLRFAAVLEERRRMARDLHDSLAQVFTGVGYQIDSMVRRLGGGTPEVVDRLSQLRKTLNQGRRASRIAIWNLRAPVGESGSLAKALEELASLYEDVQVRLTVNGTPRRLPLPVEDDLLHIAQQAVNNAIEHGHAAHIGLELSYERDGVGLYIRDDGEGFEVKPGESPRTGHYGLHGMQERAERSGGSLTIESSPGVGTEVAVLIAGAGRWRSKLRADGGLGAP